LAGNEADFDVFGRVENFFFFSNLAIIKANPVPYASRILLQQLSCNPEGATSVNFAKAGLGSQGCPFG